MDFMRILRSLEEFLYEVMTWLVFYPKTFWMSVRRPIATLRYSDQQQDLPSEEQYAATLNPVLFLMLSLLIVHGLELAARAGPSASQIPLPAVMQSDTNLLFVRSIFFGVFPLAFALSLLWRTRSPLDRNTLRGPFLAQCHTATVFATIVGLGTQALLRNEPRAHWVGGALIAFALVWYVGVQGTWLSERLSIGRARGLGLAMLICLGAAITFVLAAAILSAF